MKFFISRKKLLRELDNSLDTYRDTLSWFKATYNGEKDTKDYIKSIAVMNEGIKVLNEIKRFVN